MSPDLEKQIAWWKLFDDLPQYSRLVRRQPPELLWHYTTPEGFLGIMSSGVLHASDLAFLNDPSEGLVGWSRAMDVAHAEERDSGAAVFIGRVRAALHSYLLNPRSAMQPKGVVCFCEGGDLLSQWRGYAKSGRGYALGFRSTALPRLEPELVLAPIIYDESGQRAILKELLAYGGGLFGSYEHDIAKLFGVTVFSRILFLSHLFKLSGFGEEKEWRVIQAPSFERYGGVLPSGVNHNCGIRSGAHGLIPYYTINLGDRSSIPLVEVKVGPAFHSDLGPRGVRSLLTIHGLQDRVRVSQSSIVFRP